MAILAGDHPLQERSSEALHSR